MMQKAQADWRHFEIAVKEFLSAIGSGAKVTHDKQVPDVHTGLPRQRDVWIEWSLWMHFPVKALISCKFWSTPLDQGDIDHFNGEFISSGAQVGVVYSRTGFNEHALAKARVLNFHCCKLYDNQPAELPSGLLFDAAFHFRPRFQVSVRHVRPEHSLKTWQDVLRRAAGERSVFEQFVEVLEAHQDGSGDARWNRARAGSHVVISTTEKGEPPLEVSLRVADRKYRSKLEFTLISGSYNLTAGAFLGSQSTPWVDTQSADPGPGWEEVEDVPVSQPKPSVVMFMKANSSESLSSFGDTPFPTTSGGG